MGLIKDGTLAAMSPILHQKKTVEVKSRHSQLKDKLAADP